MFGLNDPILIPHRDFLRSFFVDQPISGPRPPDHLTPSLLSPLVAVSPVHGAALCNKRSPVPILAGTPSRASWGNSQEIFEGGEGHCEHRTPDRVSVLPRLPTADDDTPLPSSLNAANIQIAVQWNHQFKTNVFWEKILMSSFFAEFFMKFLKNSASDDTWWLKFECSRYSYGIINF